MDFTLVSLVQNLQWIIPLTTFVLSAKFNKVPQSELYRHENHFHLNFNQRFGSLIKFCIVQYLKSVYYM